MRFAEWEDDDPTLVWFRSVYLGARLRFTTCDSPSSHRTGTFSLLTAFRRTGATHTLLSVCLPHGVIFTGDLAYDHTLTSLFAHSPLASIPLSSLAGRRDGICIRRQVLGAVRGRQRGICEARRGCLPARRPDLDPRLPSAPRSVSPPPSASRSRRRALRTHALPELRGVQVPAAPQGDPRRHARREPDLLPDILVLATLHVIVHPRVWLRGHVGRRHRCAGARCGHWVLSRRRRRGPRREGHVRAPSHFSFCVALVLYVLICFSSLFFVDQAPAGHPTEAGGASCAV